MKVVCLGKGERCQCMVYQQEGGGWLVLVYTEKEQLYQYLKGLGAQAYHSAGLCRLRAGAGMDWEQFAGEVTKRVDDNSGEVIRVLRAVKMAASALDVSVVRSRQALDENFKIATNKPIGKMDYTNLFFCSSGRPYICDSEVVARGRGGLVFPFSCGSQEELVYLIGQAELGMARDGHHFNFPKMVMYARYKFSDWDAIRAVDAEQAAERDVMAVAVV